MHIYLLNCWYKVELLESIIGPVSKTHDACKIQEVDGLDRTASAEQNGASNNQISPGHHTRERLTCPFPRDGTLSTYILHCDKSA